MADMNPYDPNVVAYIFAAKGKSNRLTEKAIADYSKTSDSKGSDKNQAYSSKVDVASDTSDSEEDSQHDSAGTNLEKKRKDLIYFEIRFDDPPRTKAGFTFGRDAKLSEFVLPLHTRASGRHFALTFDHENQLIVRDLRSKYGTRVIYGNPKAADASEVVEAKCRMGSKRGQMDWSARGPSMAGGFHPIINVDDEVQFQIIVPNHNVEDAEYREKVSQYRQGAAADKLMEGVEENTGVLKFVLKYMLKFEAKERCRAEACFRIAVQEFSTQPVGYSAGAQATLSPMKGERSDESRAKAGPGHGEEKSAPQSPGLRFDKADRTKDAHIEEQSTIIHRSRAKRVANEAHGISNELNDHADYIAAPPRNPASAVPAAEPRSSASHSLSPALRMAIMHDLANCDAEKADDTPGPGLESLDQRKRERLDSRDSRAVEKTSNRSKLLERGEVGIVNKRSRLE